MKHNEDSESAFEEVLKGLKLYDHSVSYTSRG